MSRAVQILLGPMVPQPFRVVRVKRETCDTYSIELTAAAGGKGFEFAPGQFNMLYVFGKGEVPVSISGDPAAPERLVHTARRVGRVTQAICRLRPGQCLGVRGPYGTAWPLEAAVGMDVVVVAGGIGLAPLRPALYALCRQRQRYGRVAVLYGARTPRDVLYRAELQRWSARLDLELMATVDRGTTEWRGNVGVVTGLIRRAGFDPQQAVAMVCGPEVMMRYAVDELRRRGVDGERIWVSMERNMKCGVGLCGHCQMGPHFACRHGAVFRYDAVEPAFAIREL